MRHSLFVALVALALSACSSSTTPADAGSGSLLPALPGYAVSVWADGGSLGTNPDNIDFDGTHVWITYQNNSQVAGGPNEGISTIVEYSADGQSVVDTYSVAGHCDGMRWDTDTKLIWATSNEDANPALYSIDPTKPAASAVTTYTLAWPDGASSPPHGGGLDDLWFINGKMFVSGSNPALNSAGINTGPALYSVTISGTTATFAAALMGNASGVNDVATGNTNYTINEIDPDSLSTDGAGDLVLIDQAGQDLLVISNPGTPTQAVTRYGTGSQLDDTVWIPTAASGVLLVADASKNTIWKVTGPFAAGQVYTELPNDSGVAGVVGLLDIANADVVSNGYAIVDPVAIGFGKPTGLLFVPQ